MCDKQSRVRIEKVWGFFCNDFNFRNYRGMVESRPDDYRNLTPEALLEWYESIGAVGLTWNQYKLQNGHTTFTSKVQSGLDVPQMKHMPPDFYQRFCQLSRERGSYTLAYTCGGDDHYAFYHHPEWFEEYGYAFACLNAQPYWDREFALVREALTLFPCDGFFYDMIFFSGMCRCDYCKTAYRRLYAEALPDSGEPIPRFRSDTFRHWVQRAVQACRDVVPDIEVSINHQWHPEGMPYELADQFDWYFGEFGYTEWVRDILCAYGGHKHFMMQCGDSTPEAGSLPPARVAHLISRGIGIISGETLVNPDSGLCPSENDFRTREVRKTMQKIEMLSPYLVSAPAISHTAILFSGAAEAWQGRDRYTSVVGLCMQEATRMNLSCCKIEILEQLTKEKLDACEVVFAPDTGWMDQAVLKVLAEWVSKGGILFASGPFSLTDAAGYLQPDFQDDGLLGLHRMPEYFDTAGVLASCKTPDGILEMEHPAAVDGIITCMPVTAQPVGFGRRNRFRHRAASRRWGDAGLPLLWQNFYGKGVVFYLACNSLFESDGQSVDMSGALESLRTCLSTLLMPHIRKAPFRTTTRYPAEIWLNRQTEHNRLVLHALSYERPLHNEVISIRDDLMATTLLELVYPSSKKTHFKGVKENGYVHFLLPEISEHLVFTAQMPIAPELLS